MSHKTSVALLTALLAIAVFTVGLMAEQGLEPEIVLLRKMVTTQKNLLTMQDQLLSDYADEMAKLKAKCAER